MGAYSKQQLVQEGQYTFPYHFIPHDVNGAWMVSTHLWWGYEYLAILDSITNLVIGHQPRRVLDFGCGDGRLISELCKKGVPELYGIDFSKRALLLSQVMVDHNDRVKLFANLEEIRDQRFDVAIAMEVIEHIPPDETRSIFRALHRALDKQGSLIVSVPTKNIPLHRKHYRHFTIRELQDEIAELFVIDRVFFVHRVGAIGNILRRAVVNKFLIPLWPPWIKLTTMLYKRFVMEAQEYNGAHLIAVLRKAEKGS
jgi:SAM-dependent methyltransferase